MTLTVKEAATLARVSRSLIYELLRNGRLRASRVGCRGRGKWLIESEELQRFLGECQQTTISQIPLKHIK